VDQDLIDFAGKIFGLARSGDAESLAAYVDAGVPNRVVKHIAPRALGAADFPSLTIADEHR
jgi:hypothetical protein